MHFQIALTFKHVTAFGRVPFNERRSIADKAQKIESIEANTEADADYVGRPKYVGIVTVK